MEQLATQHRANRFANALNFRNPDGCKSEHFDVVAEAVEIVQWHFRRHVLAVTFGKII